MERQTNDQLAKNGLIAELQYKTSKVKEAELANRNQIEDKRLSFARDSIEPQLAGKQAAVDQAKQLAKLKADQVEALHVRAGMSGVLQQLPVQIGQRMKIEVRDDASEEPLQPIDAREHLRITSRRIDQPLRADFHAGDCSC